MTPAEPFGLRSQRLGCLPIMNFLFDRMGLVGQLQTYLPSDDARLRLAPAEVIATVVRNIVAGHRPVYALSEWAASYDPVLLGFGPGEAELLNDDRVGRMLDRLFDADRASLITSTVLGVIREFNIETTQLHNDSTTVTVTGNYPDADGQDRGGKPTPAIRHGHNKDHRPDLLPELREVPSQIEGQIGGGAPMVAPHDREGRASEGSRLPGCAVDGFAGGDRRPVGALSAP